MKVEEIFFRDIYHQICLLTGTGVVALINVNEVFDFPPDEKFDGFLTYAYIDDAAFVFEILAGAQVVGERVKIFPAGYKKSVKLKRGQVDDAELRILTEEYSLAFRDKIQMINDRTFDAALERVRLVKNLDAFRHPHYPDDVIVYFLSQDSKPELLWVRSLSVDEKILTGKLLNEPTKNFGCHEGDEIKFGVIQVNKDKILIYLPPKEDSFA